MLHSEITDQELFRYGLKSADSRAIKAALNPSPVQNPLGPPSISGTTLTIDLALQQPTRLTQILIDLTLQRFFVDRVFQSAGGVTGGAVIYDKLEANDLYAHRDVQRVAPGAEFPLIDFQRRTPYVATVQKWGGKFVITDEARDRNDVAVFTRAMTQMGNTIVRKINQLGVATLATGISGASRTFSGVSWSSVVTGGSSQSNATSWPQRDFAKANLIADQDEMGMTFDLWIMNPTDYFNLGTVYGPFLSDMLSSMGVDIYVTNRATAGSPYIVASNQVGQMRLEQPLQTETWRDPQGRQQTWVQSSVRPLMFVDNTFAVLQATGVS